MARQILYYPKLVLSEQNIIEQNIYILISHFTLLLQLIYLRCTCNNDIKYTILYIFIELTSPI